MDIATRLQTILAPERIKARLIDLMAYAPDAGFYYLLPKAVVQPVTEEEVIALFDFSRKHRISLTFRTGGTSLSGQAISDGLLVDLSQYWKGVKVENDGACIRLQPGVIGAMANAWLKPYGRKIGPDPASIQSAMIGGILSNNASGMCCGVSRNSYHTTRSIRFILPDGNRFSTEQPEDYERFGKECPELSRELQLLREQIKEQPQLYELIRKKYKSKNTVGYAINALIDYERPLDIMAHLLIGAEGTLGFIAEAVMDTIPDYPVKSTALLYFHTIYDACRTIPALIEAGAEAVELMDRASLRSITHIKGIPEIIHTLPEEAAALLVEFQGQQQEEVDEKTRRFLTSVPQLSLLSAPDFTSDPAEQAFLWKVRKGLFPAIGAVRQSGTSVILEDIAFPIQRLSDAVLDLQSLFAKHAYEDAIIFGHAKDGNLHFVITQAFDSAAEIARYQAFLEEVVELVVRKYQGALKAEHGTGRNMAPFVESEWGGELYAIMKRIKKVVDPDQLLNPGVIINEDPKAHIQHLKELPQVESEVDKCMECGFCEYKCPSRDLTLTPRQRIVVRRQLALLERNGEKARRKQLLKEYQYDGLDTCAVDGLCATACPVDINTGALVKRLRKENHSPSANQWALRAAKHFYGIELAVKTGIRTGQMINRVFGQNSMRRLSAGCKKLLPGFPLWSNQLAAAAPISGLATRSGEFVYFPTCISRVMGKTPGSSKSIAETFSQVASKAGIPLFVPSGIQGSCCGQPFSSKGFQAAFSQTANNTIEKLWHWSARGSRPVILDISSCTHTLKDCRPQLSAENQQRFDGLQLIDSIEFIADHLLPRLTLRQKKKRIALHPVCSLQHMGLENKLMKAAGQLAEEVIVPPGAGCCGMAGDRGFLFPELTRSATAAEAASLKEGAFDGYYSSSKTCEIALSEAVQQNYQSLIQLVDECS